MAEHGYTPDWFEPEVDDGPKGGLDYAPDWFDQPEKDNDGVLSALGGGFEETGKSLAATYNTITGDLAAVEDIAQSESDKTEQQQRFLGRIADLQSEGDDSVWQGIKNVFSAASDEPVGALHETVGQLPNSAVVLGGMAAGAKAGATFEGVFAEQKAIFDAIAARDAVAAESAMERHLDSVSRLYWQHTTK